MKVIIVAVLIICLLIYVLHYWNPEDECDGKKCETCPFNTSGQKCQYVETD